MTADQNAAAEQQNADWLNGYRWALEHLTDPGVLNDAARYAIERETPSE